MRSKRATVRLVPLVLNNNASFQPSRGHQQQVIISQLLQMIGNVRHIDELFYWLARILSKSLGIDVIQFWTLQNYADGQATLELRTMVSRNLELPQNIVINPDVVGQIRHVLKKRSGLMPSPVNMVFSQSQANLFTHNKLNYYACYFLCNGALLPPVTSQQTGSKKLHTPLIMVVSLFMHQTPAPRLLPTVGHILEQTVLIAKKRGLLVSSGQLS